MDSKNRSLAMEAGRSFRFFINPIQERPGSSEGFGSDSTWAPPTDVYETRNALVVKMAIPGIRTGDVQIRFSNRGIIIAGYRSFQKDNAMETYHQMEIRSGRFERRIGIQMPLDPEHATARYEDGILTVQIPKHSIKLPGAYTVRFKL